MELARRPRRHVRIGTHPYPAWELGAECTDAANGGGMFPVSFGSLRLRLTVR
jgi:hypothetical protein